MRGLPEFPGYGISADGSVWSCWKRRRRTVGKGTEAYQSKTWRLLVPVLVGKYLRVSLKTPCGVTSCSVAELVLRAYVGPRPHGCEVLHGPGGKLDNSTGNLRWGTKQENMADKARDGTAQRGEGHPRVKLTTSEVMEIRKQGHTVPLQRQAERYGVTRACVSRILCGLTWKHLLVDVRASRPAVPVRESVSEEANLGK